MTKPLIKPLKRLILSVLIAFVVEWILLVWAPMKLYKIGQPQAIEPAIENKTQFIDKQRLVLPALNEKLTAPNPGLEKVVQFCLTFPSG